jgi:hypothetical protein
MRGTVAANIRIAGNTYVPALLALRVKGYRLRLSYTKIDNENDPRHPYSADWEAEKDGASFSATTPVELLGLVALWETRGENWKPLPGEGKIWDELSESARTFDLDGIDITDQDV